MMGEKNFNFFLFISLCTHIILLLALIVSMNFYSPIIVFENTNKHDVISAVILGDTPKSKILPQKEKAPVPLQAEKKPEKAEKPVAKNIDKKFPIDEMRKDLIALKKKPKQSFFAKDLLADIKNQKEKQKTFKNKDIQKQFSKKLQQEAEKSLRQQLLNEEVKLNSTETRESQGRVDKFKALILQAISENWIIPLQSRKDLYCELKVKLAADGKVLAVSIAKTSGDPALDSSARVAVMKASPLPVPKDPKDFSSFKEFVLKVKPENVIAKAT